MANSAMEARPAVLSPVQVQGLDSVAAIAAGFASIVWRSKATEPSGDGDIMDLVNSAMEQRQTVILP